MKDPRRRPARSSKSPNEESSAKANGHVDPPGDLPPVTPEAPTNRSRRWILAALMCTMMLAAMDNYIVSTAVPQIVGDLGGFSLFSWVFSIYLLAQTVTIPIYGKLSDLFGRKPILIFGTLVFLIGSAACGAAWDMKSLIAFRALQGFGAGAIMATVSTLAGDLYSVRERAVIQGWLSSVWGMAALAGPLLGGAFAEYITWRWIFFINLPIGAVALLLITTFLHERVERHRPRIDYAGSALVLASVGMLIFGLSQGGQAWPWFSPQSLGVFGITALLIAITVVVERRAIDPIIPGWLWHRRELAMANLATLGLGLAMMAPNVYLPTFMQSVRGLGAIAAGMVLASMSIGWPMASAFSGQLYTRIGFRDTALIGGSLLIVGATGFVLIPSPQPTWMIVVDQIILGAGFGLVSTPLLVGVQSVVGWSQRGVTTGANMFSRYLGQSIGAAMFGAIFNSVVSGRLQQAPAEIASELPKAVDGVVAVLNQAETSIAAKSFLREAINAATTTLFVTMAIVTVLTFLAVFLAPRQFSPESRE